MTGQSIPPDSGSRRLAEQPHPVPEHERYEDQLPLDLGLIGHQPGSHANGVFTVR
jgi:hypothetical protein